jgi:hypothetical protein
VLSLAGSAASISILGCNLLKAFNPVNNEVERLVFVTAARLV